MDDGSAVQNKGALRFGWERDNRENFRCQNEDPPNIGQKCCLLY